MRLLGPLALGGAHLRPTEAPRETVESDGRLRRRRWAIPVDDLDAELALYRAVLLEH